MTTDLPKAPLGLRGWFGKLRRRRWLALFGFEFMVVLLGVLVAQALAANFADRAERKRADDAMDALRVELGLLDLEIEKRRRSYWCTVYRLLVMQDQLNGSETTVPHLYYHPPSESLVTFAGWDSATIGAMRPYLEPAEIQTIVRIGERSNQLAQLQQQEREAWNAIHRISEDLGDPSEADRSAAKGGLVAGKLAIGSIVMTAQALRNDIKTMGVETDFSELEIYRDASSACEQAIGYDADTHNAVLQETGRLVTGQKVPGYFERSAEARKAAAAGRE